MAFDLDTYQRLVRPVDLDGIDFSAFADEPLDESVLRCLRYMHDVESHTVCYLRDLLVTRAHLDPEITTFLTFWNYEEFWHGEAIGRVLAAHGEAAGAARIEPMRSAMGWRSSIAPIGWMAFSAMTTHFVAIHMTFGVVNEWTTQGGYARLLAIADHPVLTDLLRRIMKQEGRHIDYYRSEAAGRLAADAGARRIVRFALKRLWSPVGSKVMPKAETRHLVTTLFGDADGAAVAARIDRRIDALPGLDGLGLLAGVLATHGVLVKESRPQRGDSLTRNPGQDSTVMAYSGQLSAARRAGPSSSLGSSPLTSRTA